MSALLGERNREHMTEEQHTEEEFRAAAPAPKGGKPKKGGQDRVNRMGTGSIPKLMIEFAIPAVLGVVINGAYNLIDSVFLGHGAGEIGLSAITVAAPTMTIFLALAMLIGNGGNALCALRLGEGKRDEAENILGNTFTVSLIASAIFAVCAHIPFFIEPLLSLSSATDAVRPYARTFIQIISLGCAFQVIGMGINNFIRTAGAPNRALVTMVIGAVACTVFNAIFVLGLGLGVAGSAWATVCGQALSCVSVLWYFIKTPGVPLRLRKKYLAIKPKLVKSILSLGLASFAVQVGAVVVNVVVNHVLVKYGAMSPIGSDNALASIGVVQRIAMFVVFPLIGVSIAAQPLLGFNYGAKLLRRVKTTLKVAALGATGIGAVSWVLIMAFAPQIVTFFGITEDGLVDFTAFALRVQLLMLPLVGSQIVGSNYFQATGQPAKSIMLSLTRQIIFLVPMLLILPQILPSIVPALDPLDAVYFSTPVADFLSIFTTGVFVFIEWRKLTRLIKEQDAAKKTKAAKQGA